MSRRAPSLLREVVKVCAPIVVGEACLALREHLRREHKARLRREAEASQAAEDDATDETEA